MWRTLVDQDVGFQEAVHSQNNEIGPLDFLLELWIIYDCSLYGSGLLQNTFCTVLVQCSVSDLH